MIDQFDYTFRDGTTVRIVRLIEIDVTQPRG